jgi:serine/threonine-protein kinase
VQQLGRYQVLEEIARGGMGVVYRASDTALNRLVALKLLRGQALGSEKVRKRFEREAEALARVEHPHVIRLFDRGWTPAGDPYLVLELVEGESLQRRLSLGGALDVESACRLTLTLCRAVDACHAVGVLHRDMKPDNVLLTRDGTPKLTDFGLARDIDPASSRSRLTADGKFLGSPGYWAPEQALGKLEQVDVRTDVYGLGATLFALLTGQAPQQATTLAEVMRAVEAEKPAPSSLNPAVPRWLDRVLAQALATDPQARFESAGAFGDALEREVEAPPRAASGRSAAVGAVLVASGLLMAGVLWVRDPPEPGGAGSSPSAASVREGPSPSVTESAGGAEGGGQPEGTPEAPYSETASWAAEVEEAFRRGVEAGERGDDRVAFEAFTEVIRLDPGAASAHLNRAMIATRVGDYATVMADAEAALRLVPNSGPAHALRGYAHAALGDLAQALEDYDQALRLGVNDANTYQWRGLARGRRGDWQGQLDDLTQALRLEPARQDLYVARGVARTELGDWVGAIADYDAELRRQPDHLDARINRGVANMQLGRFQEAIADFSAVLELAPDDAAIWSSRGAARNQVADFAGAIEDCSRAIALSPSWADPLANRGVAHAGLGQHEQAIEDYSRFLAMEPGDFEVLSSRALSLARLGRLEQAIDDWRLALSTQPDHPGAPGVRGNVAVAERALAERAPGESE